MMRIVIFVIASLISSQVLGLGAGGGAFRIGMSHDGQVIYCDYKPASEGGNGEFIDTEAADFGPAVRLFVPETQCALYDAIYDENGVPTGDPLCDPDLLSCGGSVNFGSFAIDVTYSGDGYTGGDDPDSGHGNGPGTDPDNTGNKPGSGGGGTADPTTGLCEGGVVEYAFYCDASLKTYGGIYYVGAAAERPWWTAGDDDIDQCANALPYMVDTGKKTITPPEEGQGCVLTIGGYPQKLKGKKPVLDTAACADVFPAKPAPGLDETQVLSYSVLYSKCEPPRVLVDASALESRYCHAEEFKDVLEDYENLDCNPEPVGNDIVYHTGESEGAVGEIDISENFNANPTINLSCSGDDKDNGNVPFTILGSDQLDATNIEFGPLPPYEPPQQGDDPIPDGTPAISAVGAPEGFATPVKANYTVTDVNLDGYNDAVLRFYSCQGDDDRTEMTETGIAQLINQYGVQNPDGTYDVRVVGKTLGGTTFFGVTSVNVN